MFYSHLFILFCCFYFQKCEAFPANNACTRPQAEQSIQHQNVKTAYDEKQQNKAATPENVKQRRILRASRGKTVVLSPSIKQN